MNLKRLTQTFLPLFFLLFSIQTTFAQDEKEEPEFFTGISPVILQRGTTEINFLNTLNSFWLAIHEYNPNFLSTRIRDRQRYTRVEQLLRVTYGFSKQKNWDLSAELKFSHARLDDEARSSPFKVFQKQTVEGINNEFLANNSYHGLSSVGLRLRAAPFAAIPELTVQGTYQIPVAQSSADRYAFGVQRNQAGLSATYFIQSGANTYYFFQADWLTLFKSVDNHFMGHQPSLSSVIVIRVFDAQWYVFPGLSYSAALSESFYKINEQLFGSLGVFYQPNPKFSILLNWQLPLIYNSSNRYSELIKSSFTGVTLGLRTVISSK